MEKQETSIIYGKNAVTETLTSGREIDTVYVQKGASLGKILALAKKSGAVVKEVSDEKMTAMCGTPKHGGTAAELASASYSTVEDILAAAEEKGKPPFIIIADEIEDPHNLGAIIRTAEAARSGRADNPEAPQRFPQRNGIQDLRRRGGMAQSCQSANLVDTIKRLKEHGVWVYGMEADGTPFDKADLSGAVALVIGSEGFGLGRLVRENCDMTLSLPMFGKVNSLNASVSAGILMYEVVKHRG